VVASIIAPSTPSPLNGPSAIRAKTPPQSTLKQQKAARPVWSRRFFVSKGH
jgi:hypothetical protein